MAFSRRLVIILNSSVRLSAVNENGESFIDDLQAGDLWFFPAGVPHSIQAQGEGVEFLLVFDQGCFSEDDTDLVTELFDRNPMEVLAKNCQTDILTFDNLPQMRYIFNGSPLNTTLQEVIAEVNSPAGMVLRDQYHSYHMSQATALKVPGGSIKIADPTVFPVANNFSAALFTIRPGAMREIHWHLTSDEWKLFLQSRARITSFMAPQASRTFNFSAGDVGYIPIANSHYIENTGSGDVIYLEILQAPKYQDVSAGQWLGSALKQVVKDTLSLPQSFVDTLPKTKRWVVPGNANYSTTNFTVSSYPKANPAQGRSGSGKARRQESETQPRAWSKNKAWELD